MFRRITLEIIVNSEGGNLDESQQAILKRMILMRIEQLVPVAPPWFGNSWVEDWQALCAVKSGWFKQLWPRKEWTVIRAIDKLVQTGDLFNAEEKNLPSLALLQLKDAYASAAAENKAL